MEEKRINKAFLDEYEISSALKKSLRLGKKLEEYDLIIHDAKRFKYGQDYKKTLKIVGTIESVLPIRMRVKVYFFSMGENCYSMNLSQKLHYCELKKPKIAVLLKEGLYKKAKKMLTNIREMTERTDKHQREEEDIKKELDSLLPFRKSSILNITLCQWKLGQWKELFDTCELILKEIDVGNSKIFFRQCVAMFERKEYDLLIQKYKQFASEHPDALKDAPEIADLYSKATKLEQEVKSKEKEMYKNILMN